MLQPDSADGWEKRSGESFKAYAAFCLYRDMGPGRSLAAAHQKAKGGLAGGAASGQWTAWMAKFEWKRRAEDYDVWFERQSRRERETAHKAELESYRARQKQLAQVALAAATQILQKAGKRLSDLEPADIPIKSIGQMFRAAAMLSQSATDAEAVALSVTDLLEQFEIATEDS